tara:strand:+ start:227880 stop:228134 length:255 start_codon:yes stop_codon:yes gene_type:complete
MKSTDAEIISLYDNTERGISNVEFKLLFAKYITMKDLIKKSQPRSNEISKFLKEQLKLVSKDIAKKDTFLSQLEVIDTFFERND